MEITGKILPKQATFLDSRAKEVLYSGAFGAGKTRALCYKAVQQALTPNNLVGLCRKTCTSLRKTTLRTLLSPDGNLPPVLPKGSYTHKKMDHIIKLNGAGEIIYFGFDDELSIASLNLGDCCIDEGIELKEDEYMMLLGRLRGTASPLRQLYTVTNPGHPGHFLHKRFFQDKNDNREIIKTNSFDNVFLPTDYLDMLRGFTGQRKNRFVEGVWCAFEGLIYDIFDRNKHVVPRDEQWKRLIVGVDAGYKNPAVLLLIGVDGDERIHVISEFYESKVLQGRLIEEAKKLNGEIYIVDPSASGLIADMESNGLDVLGANNKVVPGIYCVLDMLKVQPDGKPRLTVAPECVNTITEFESYQWKDKGAKDEPVKELDHAMDALRYIIMYLTDSSLQYTEPNIF